MGKALSKAISNRNVMAKKFDTVDFEGAWLASFGRPELAGTWLIYGVSGSGKTSFTMQLCKYLSRFQKVAYNSLEQGLSLSLQRAWGRVGMNEAGNNVILLPGEGIEDLRVRLKKRNSPGVVIIDSIQYWFDVRIQDIVRLKRDFPNKLFVFISHEKKGEPEGYIARKIKYDGEVKVRVKGYKASVTSRFADPDTGEGGADFVIWDEGASKYWNYLLNGTTDKNKDYENEEV